jgi:hypothetical protein
MDATNRPVVSNTTPLINLAGVGLLDLLPHIYGTITISAVVQEEYEAGMRSGEPLLDQLPWLRIVEFAPVDAILPHNLDVVRLLPFGWPLQFVPVLFCLMSSWRDVLPSLTACRS